MPRRQCNHIAAGKVVVGLGVDFVVPRFHILGVGVLRAVASHIEGGVAGHGADLEARRNGVQLEKQRLVLRHVDGDLPFLADEVRFAHRHPVVTARHAKLVGRIAGEDLAFALDANLHLIRHGVDDHDAGPAVDGLDAQAGDIGQVRARRLRQKLLVVCPRLLEQAQVVLALRDHEQVLFLGQKVVRDLELDQGLLFVASLEETDARLVVLAGLRGVIGLLRLRGRARDQKRHQPERE